jgi:hypothetical protein
MARTCQVFSKSKFLSTDTGLQSFAFGFVAMPWSTERPMPPPARAEAPPVRLIDQAVQSPPQPQPRCKVTFWSARRRLIIVPYANVSTYA